MAKKWSLSELRDYLTQAAGSSETDEPKERRRLQIVRAATELFVRQGYRKTSMSEVADLAGVAKGTIYLYAKDKADLMLQALAEEKQRFLDVLRPVLEDGLAPAERLRLWVRTALVVNTEMPLVSRLLSGDREIVAVLAEIDSAVQDRALEVQLDLAVMMLDDAARPHRWTESELRDRARVLIGLLYSSAHLSEPWVRGWLSTDRFAELLSEMVVSGVCPGPPRA